MTDHERDELGDAVAKDPGSFDVRKVGDLFTVMKIAEKMRAGEKHKEHLEHLEKLHRGEEERLQVTHHGGDLRKKRRPLTVGTEPKLTKMMERSTPPATYGLRRQTRSPSPPPVLERQRRVRAAHDGVAARPHEGIAWKRADSPSRKMHVVDGHRIKGHVPKLTGKGRSEAVKERHDDLGVIRRLGRALKQLLTDVEGDKTGLGGTIHS